MGMNTLATLRATLEQQTNRIEVDPELARKALVPLQRMLDFRAQR
jgi:quinolinate synthase